MSSAHAITNIERRAGQAAVLDAVELADPVEALREAFLGGCRFWAAEHALVRKLTGLATVDNEIKRVIADIQRHRLPLLIGLVERLSDVGGLSPSVSVDRALDVLWMLSSFEAFDQLFAERQLPVDVVAEVLADVAVRAVIRQQVEQ